MGFLRFWLATAVLLSHTSADLLPGVFYVNGGLSVSGFYVISGFLIQLVISNKYVKQGPWIADFYRSRALRIFPLYYLFAAITYFYSGGLFNAIWQTGNLYTWTFTVFENAFIFGQDIGRFLVVEMPSGNLNFGDPSSGSFRATELPLLGQSWSLAIELGFYLVAPFILTKSTRFVILCCVASLAARIAISIPFGTGPNDLWNAFLPSEIGTFLLGALGFRFYRALMEDARPRRSGIALIISIALWNMSWGKLYNFDPHFAWGGFIVLVTIAVPIVFAATKGNQFDRFVGEMSYPIYITHMLLIEFAKTHGILPGLTQALFVWCLSILVAIPLVYIAERPLSAFRHKTFLRKAHPSDGAV